MNTKQMRMVDECRKWPRLLDEGELHFLDHLADNLGDPLSHGQLGWLKRIYERDVKPIPPEPSSNVPVGGTGAVQHYRAIRRGFELGPIVKQLFEQHKKLKHETRL